MAILCLAGEAIRVEFRRDLRARRGQLDPRGPEVHAATFLRRRLMILDSALEQDSNELARIFIHEVFHFTWTRLGNPLRRSFENILELELNSRARGELGWSSEYRKKLLALEDPTQRTRKWREYCCESFCDTAAFLLAECGDNAEFTLSQRHRERRRAWFRASVLRQSIPV